MKRKINSSNPIELPIFLIRLGLAFVFIYAAISMSLDMQSYLHYFPKFLLDVFPTPLLFHSLAIFEIILSIWILSGKKAVLSSSIAAVLLFSITTLNLDSFNVLFRNVSIFLSSVALALISSNKKS